MVPIYDETHHRDGGFPYAVVFLIAANFVIFFMELINGSQWSLQYALVPDSVVHGVALWTIITAMFIHAGWLHILGNMIYLWVFGDELDADYMGSGRFIAFYFICGLAATVLQIAVDPTSKVPNLGASGAIAGVLGGFLLIFPHDKILTFFLVPIPIPVRLSAAILVGFWFLFQLASGLLSLGGSDDQGGVAYFAHVGGFLAGLALVKLFAEPRINSHAGGSP
ncbi:MAG TPA: rhomboid family intramembrane serine protease [Chloroflexota bacterium]|nr:rhomboid family intramembrane serine protease [Chloroflexota bacterium]